MRIPKFIWPEMPGKGSPQEKRVYRAEAGQENIPEMTRQEIKTSFKRVSLIHCCSMMPVLETYEILPDPGITHGPSLPKNGRYSKH